MLALFPLSPLLVYAKAPNGKVHFPFIIGSKQN